MRVSVAALAASVVFAFAPAPAAAAEPTCQDVTFPVSVAGLAQTMAGTLCTPAGATTVQILVPGGFYNRAYWDAPMSSFRGAMNNAGYATLALDRLGTGRSSTPPSALLTAIVDANALHQVVQALRPQFAKVILGGHSLGSAISVIEAATYRDVDGVVVTAMGHPPLAAPSLFTVLGIAPIAATFVPAVLDPAFSDRPLDPGYLTTMAGTCYSFCGLLATDCHSSVTYRSAEAPFYGQAARMEAYVLPGYGHALNYAPNAPTLHATVVAWANRMIGR